MAQGLAAGDPGRSEPDREAVDAGPAAKWPHDRRPSCFGDAVAVAVVVALTWLVPYLPGRLR